MLVLPFIAIVGQLKAHSNTGCFASLSSGALPFGCEIRFGSGSDRPVLRLNLSPDT